jgi:F-type H+-transporting ATPase subunit a
VMLAVLFSLTISGGLLIGWLPLAISVLVYGLEAALIAGIQAYIFTILTCVYLGDAFHLHGHEEHAH